MEEERAKDEAGSDVPDGAKEPEKQGTGPEQPDPDAKALADEAGAASLYRQLCAARAAGRWVRLGIVVVLLVVILGEVYYGYAMFRDAARGLTQAKIQAMAVEQFRPILERAMSDGRQMFDELRPVYLEEVRKQADERWPEMREKLMAEARTYGQNVAGEGKTILDARVKKLGEEQRDKLAKEFGVEDPKKLEVVLTNLQTALRGAIVDVLEERMGEAEDRILRIHRLAVTFLPEERQAGFQTRVEKVWDQFSSEIKGARETLEKVDEEIREPEA